jgi:GntR family transcriptional regulator
MIGMVTLVIMERLVIDPHAPEPSYQQLAGQLRARIRSGAIGPREPLPSITYMTGETGLAIGTVRHAIEVLVTEGWAYTVPGRGTYAAEKPPAGGAG